MSSVEAATSEGRPESESVDSALISYVLDVHRERMVNWGVGGSVREVLRTAFDVFADRLEALREQVDSGVDERACYEELRDMLLDEG